MSARRGYTIHLGRVSEIETDIELFPDPRKVFKAWDEALAERVLPVVSFDLALVGQRGRAVFLYYEDVSVDFLEWKTDGERITSVSDAVKRMRPFPERIDAERFCESIGGRHLALDTFEVKRTQPSELPPRGWPHFLERELRAQGAEQPLARPRIGVHYPCYVQGTNVSDEDDLIEAELPAAFLDLASMYFYLSVDKREFMQQMQMT